MDPVSHGSCTAVIAPVETKGSEHPAESSGIIAVSSASGAFSGAVGARDGVETAAVAGLDSVIQAWPTLAVSVRRRILELVEEGGGP